MDLGIAGKRAIVLASSKGLGFAVARGLALEGAKVVVSSSDQGRSDDAARRIAEEAGAPVLGVAADLYDAAAVDRLADAAEAALGGVDIIVINHAGPALGLASEIDLDALHEQFEMVVANPIRLIRRLLPGMRERRWGRILSMGGISLIAALPNKVMDNTLRPSLVNYLKALSNEVAADNVTANVLVPGTFVTERVHSSTKANAKLWGISIEEAMADRIRNIPAGRFGDVEEFAALAAFLVSDRAAYMIGSVWRADGGATRSIL